MDKVKRTFPRERETRAGRKVQEQKLRRLPGSGASLNPQAPARHHLSPTDFGRVSLGVSAQSVDRKGRRGGGTDKKGGAVRAPEVDGTVQLPGPGRLRAATRHPTPIPGSPHPRQSGDPPRLLRLHRLPWQWLYSIQFRMMSAKEKRRNCIWAVGLGRGASQSRGTAGLIRGAPRGGGAAGEAAEHESPGGSEWGVPARLSWASSASLLLRSESGTRNRVGGGGKEPGGGWGEKGEAPSQFKRGRAGRGSEPSSWHEPPGSLTPARSCGRPGRGGDCNRGISSLARGCRRRARHRALHGPTRLRAKASAGSRWGALASRTGVPRRRGPAAIAYRA